MPGSEYDVLYMIALKNGWWRPRVPEDYFIEDIIKYWNGMIE